MTTRPTEDLPPYRAMLAVDVKGFSAHPGRVHHDLTCRIPRILRTAFELCDRGPAWTKGRRFHRSDGDGYVAGFHPRVLPFLVNPFLHALESVLADDAAMPTVRMRVSVNVGPVTDSGRNTIADGSGTSRIELHRLLDAEAVRQVLERSGPGTHVAAIVSARAFEDAVLTGYSGDGADHYRRVDVELKTFRGPAYLRVPNPTGGLLEHGFFPAPGSADVAEPATSPPGGTVVGINSGIVHSGVGDVHVGGRRGSHR